MDFAVVMNEGQVLALFIRICFLHSHHRTSGTGTGRLTARDIGYLMLGPVKARLVHFVGEHVFCLGSDDGQIQPSQGYFVETAIN